MRPIRIRVSTTHLAAALAPVVVGIGVAAHAHAASLPRSLGALAAALALQFLFEEFRGEAPKTPPDRRQWRAWTSPLGVAWLLLAGGLGSWLALTSLWWLLPLGLAALAGSWAWVALVPESATGGLRELALVVLFELLAGWGTILVELGRLPVLGLLAALLPAALAAALLLVSNLDALPAALAEGQLSLAVRLGGRRARTLLMGLLVVAMAVPLVIAVAGIDGAEIFLPWVAAPLAESPIRNATSPEPAGRARAVRQMTLLLAAGSLLMAIGVWAG